MCVSSATCRLGRSNLDGIEAELRVGTVKAGRVDVGQDVFSLSRRLLRACGSNLVASELTKTRRCGYIRDMSKQVKKLQAKVDWIELTDLGSTNLSVGTFSVSRSTFVMEVAGGCLVKEVMLTSSGGRPNTSVAMNFIIGARLSDFTDDELSS